MDPKVFSTEIRKTGFVLENQVAQALKAAGWTVISNRYYVDDSEETVREIDLVAYRVAKVEHIEVYTVLIISCKKSEENAWALLARDINLKDPNSDWWPLHAWSNDKPLHYQLTRPNKARQYHEGVAALGVVETVSTPVVEVFAFQEMSKSSGKPQNDKPIFGAITSLMKAQAYELSSLPERKKTPATYQFNLLSVVDTDLVRLMFKGKSIDCTALDTEHYLARYIINKRETFARIRFITANSFEKALEDYGRLHTANGNWFAAEHQAFYTDVMKDADRVGVLRDQFAKRVRFPVTWRVERQFKGTDLGEPTLSWNASDSEVKIGYVASDVVLEWINADSEVKKHVGDALASIYRYKGPFAFEYDIPF